jgi:hypothetical protein
MAVRVIWLEDDGGVFTLRLYSSKEEAAFITETGIRCFYEAHIAIVTVINKYSGLVLYYKPEGRGFFFRWGHWIFKLT